MIINKFNDDRLWIAVNSGTFISAEIPWWSENLDAIKDLTFRSFARMIESLVSSEKAILVNERLEIPYSTFGWAEQQVPDAFESIFEWSPFTLEIESRGTLALENFLIEFKFLTGASKQVTLERSGVFVNKGGRIFRLPYNVSQALDLISEFNAFEPSKRARLGIFTLNKVKNLLSNTFVQYSEYLKREESALVEKVDLRFIDDPKNGLTVVPYVEGIPTKGFQDAFIQSDGNNNVYNIENDGVILRVVVSPLIQRVLTEVKNKASKLKGKRRLQLLENPERLLTKIADDLIELDGDSRSIDEFVTFGPRVLGIGFAERVTPVVSSSNKNWFEHNMEPSAFQLFCRSDDGSQKAIGFESFDEMRELLSSMKVSKESNSGPVTFRDISFAASDELIQSLEAFVATDQSQKIMSIRSEPLQRYVLRTIDNLETLDYDVGESSSSSFQSFDIPKNFIGSLFEHQKFGLRWLQSAFKENIWKGVLLADDMGLGKTVQLLNFMSWLIETGETKTNIVGVFQPILIICPSILFDTAWKPDRDKYFRDGSFSPFLEAHGDQLKQLRKKDCPKGFETDSGTQHLDINMLTQNQVVLTNYDTIRNYQFSFASINWSLIILDEAQKVKEPGSSITKSMRALKRKFMVASTGTPVENSLINLWCILDLLHPSSLIGSLKSFRQEFGELTDDIAEKAEQLRSRLRFNKHDGLIIRRKKEHCGLNLKPKTIVDPIEVDFSDIQREMYLSILKQVGDGTENTVTKLEALMKLEAVSEHPFLLRPNPLSEDVEEYLKVCPKLSALVNVLESIQSKNEKVLIFTRRLGMQNILRHLIEKRFGLDVDLINGDAPKSKHSKDSRSNRIRKFGEKVGFNVLILSPDVAGAGLTITEANHVVHYGRWWNPAKEAQATDRAYRIGQKKPVFVYRIISKDFTHQIGKTFDENLEEIHREKMKLAEDFLYPVAIDYTEALAKNVFEPVTKSPGTAKALLNVDEISAMADFHFEALVSALYTKMGGKTILTPKSGDGGVDIVVLKDDEVLLIQCKQKKNGGEFNDNFGINQVREGNELYTGSFIPKSLRYKRVRLILFTNGKPTSDIFSYAKSKQVEVFGGAEMTKLISSNQISFGDVIAAESQRIMTLEQVKGILESAAAN